MAAASSTTHSSYVCAELAVIIFCLLVLKSQAKLTHCRSTAISSIRETQEYVEFFSDLAAIVSINFECRHRIPIMTHYSNAISPIRETQVHFVALILEMEVDLTGWNIENGEEGGSH